MIRKFNYAISKMSQEPTIISLDHNGVEFDYGGNIYIVKGSTLYDEEKFLSSFKDLFGEEVVKIVREYRKAIRFNFGGNYSFEFNRVFGNTAILTKISKSEASFILNGTFYHVGLTTRRIGNSQEKHPQYEKIIEWCRNIMESLPNDTNISDQFKNLDNTEVEDFRAFCYDVVMGGEMFLRVGANGIWGLDDSEQPIIDECFDDIAKAITACFDKIQDNYFGNRIFCYRNYSSEPEDSEIELEEKLQLEIASAVKKYNDVINQKKLENFKEQNFRIKSLDKFQYTKTDNEQQLNIEFSYGLNLIVLSLQNRNGLKSLNDMVEIENNKCRFKSLQDYVPVSCFSDFEELFRWILRTICASGKIEMIFKEGFFTNNEFFVHMVKNTIRKNFGFDIEDCHSNQGGNYQIYFTLVFESHSCSCNVTTSSITIDGISFHNGKFIQNVDIDRHIPMEKRKYVIQVIKFCAALVNFRSELEFDIERETTDFEKKLHRNLAVYVNGNDVYYFGENGNFSKYKLNTKPRNKCEEKISEEWLSANAI